MAVRSKEAVSESRHVSQVPLERSRRKSFHLRFGERLVRIVDSHNMLHPRFIRMTGDGISEIIPRSPTEDRKKPQTDESTESK